MCLCFYFVDIILLDKAVDCFPCPALSAIYELPKAQTAMDVGSDCVLERAFEDLDVACVDYRFIVGRGYRLEHGLGSFIKRFDDGRYPELVKDTPRT